MSELRKGICPQSPAVGCLKYTPSCNIFLSSTLIQEALLGRGWGTGGEEDGTLNVY